MMKKSTKSIIAIALALSVLAPIPARAMSFKDAPAADHWAYTALNDAVEQGYITGYEDGTIRYNNKMTRAEAAAMINRIIGKQVDVPMISPFRDMKASDWFYKDMMSLYRQGIIKGTSDTTISPNTRISRQEIFVILDRMSMNKDYPRDESAKTIYDFTDRHEIAPWAKFAVERLTSVGIIAGDGNKVRPKDPMSRAEFAQTVYKMKTTKEYEYPSDKPGVIREEEIGKPDEKPDDKPPIPEKPDDKPDEKPDDKPSIPDKPDDKPIEKPDEPTIPDIPKPENPLEFVDPRASRLTRDELTLANEINDYREEKGLPRIPISYNLTIVARYHTQDSYRYRPYEEKDDRGIQGNLHSWSGNGPWTKVIYTPDHAYASGMWSKPREITGFPDMGFEISTGSSGIKNNYEPLSLWKKSPGHRDVIINQGSWARRSWQSMGVSFQKGIAHVWFAENPDNQNFNERTGELEAKASLDPTIEISGDRDILLF